MTKFDLLSILSEDGVNRDKLLLALFDSYEERLKDGSLYSLSYFNPKNLIKLYYTTVDKPKFDGLMTNFKRKYIQNESQLELVHEPAEIEGLGEVYNYIHTFLNESSISIYTVLRLHQLLFSKTPYPESGGKYRNKDVYLPGTGIDLTSYSFIPQQMIALAPIAQELVAKGIQLGKEKNIDEILNYIQDCIQLNTKIIAIHPFFDGNGRTARAFLNLLFKLAGIPPVYVKPEERLEYQKAMNQAIVNQNYDMLNQFYFYKICDSIYELDIQEKLEKDETKTK